MHFLLCNNHIICRLKQWSDDNPLHFVLIYEYFFVKMTLIISISISSISITLLST